MNDRREAVESLSWAYCATAGPILQLRCCNISQTLSHYGLYKNIKKIKLS